MDSSYNDCEGEGDSLKTLVAYKENGKAHMLAFGSYYLDDISIPAENNSFYKLGNGIVMGSPTDPLSNLSLKLIAREISSMEGTITLDLEFMLDYVLPIVIKANKDCRTLEVEDGKKCLRDGILFIQGNKIFWIRRSLDAYEIDDFISIGGNSVPLYNAINGGYFSDLNYKERVIECVKGFDKYCKDKRTEVYHIDSEGMRARRLHI